MDADRIRQALRNTIGLTLDDPEADEDQEVLRAAALAHADCLDGPTDEDVEVLAKASRHTFQDRNGEWQNVVTQADLDEARRLLEAVFQARKEADRG